MFRLQIGCAEHRVLRQPRRQLADVVMIRQDEQEPLLATHQHVLESACRFAIDDKRACIDMREHQACPLYG